MSTWHENHVYAGGRHFLAVQPFAAYTVDGEPLDRMDYARELTQAMGLTDEFLQPHFDAGGLRQAMARLLRILVRFEPYSADITTAISAAMRALDASR